MSGCVFDLAISLLNQNCSVITQVANKLRLLNPSIYQRWLFLADVSFFVSVNSETKSFVNPCNICINYPVKAFALLIYIVIAFTIPV